MLLMLLGLTFQLIAMTCFCFVLLHGFQRSVGTGFMVLLSPFQSVHYGFTQFDNRRKGLIIAGWLGGFVVAVVLRILALLTYAA